MIVSELIFSEIDFFYWNGLPAMIAAYNTYLYSTESEIQTECSVQFYCNSSMLYIVFKLQTRLCIMRFMSYKQIGINIIWSCVTSVILIIVVLFTFVFPLVFLVIFIAFSIHLVTFTISLTIPFLYGYLFVSIT